MNVRALHVDMKGLTVRAEYMSSLVERIARLGYNYLLLEFEDKFSYAAYPAMAHAAAYSKDELRRLNETCRALGVGVIPLLQSVGHLDYFLKHKEHADLREGGSAYQWCLSDPRTFEAWKTMADEILEVFPDCQYFHIGADEVKLESNCPRCGSADRFELYIRRVNHCVDYLRGRGKRVVMWDDMFRHRDLTSLTFLLDKVIPCVWCYRQLDEDTLRAFTDIGCEFWGASCLQSDFYYRGMTAHEPRQDNVDAWAEANARYPLSGHVGTIWGRITCQSPLESTSLPQSMFMIAYLGRSLTRGLIRDRQEFAKEFAAEFFGCPAMDVCRIIENFSHEPDLVKSELEKWLGVAGKNQDILTIWHAFNEIDVLFRYVDCCFSANGALLPVYRDGMAPEEMTRNWLDGVRITRERTRNVKGLMDSVLLDYFPQVMLDEFKEQRFMAMLEQNDRWEQIIAQAEANRNI